MNFLKRAVSERSLTQASGQRAVSSSLGFTLVELLVVVAIIGLLAGVVTISSNAARMQARDDRREADLQNIAGSLELYRAEKRIYPATLQELAPTYISTLPKDPAGRAYNYGVSSDSRKFYLDAQLEAEMQVTLSSAPSNDPNSPSAFQTGYYRDSNDNPHYRVSGQ